MSFWLLGHRRHLTDITLTATLVPYILEQWEAGHQRAKTKKLKERKTLDCGLDSQPCKRNCVCVVELTFSAPFENLKTANSEHIFLLLYALQIL